MPAYVAWGTLIHGFSIHGLGHGAVDDDADDDASACDDADGACTALGFLLTVFLAGMAMDFFGAMMCM